MRLKARLTPFAVVMISATMLLIVTLMSLLHVRDSFAQPSQISITKVLNKATNVVRVGERLNFTIAVTNNSSLTLTNVALLDTYDNTSLAFATAFIPNDTHDPTTGIVRWNNLAAPPIPPGGRITVTIAFTAVSPKPAVVNFARAQDIVFDSGATGVPAEDDATQESIGGNAPVVKALSPPDSQPRAGFPVTFTHVISNDGLAVMTFLPLTDTYNASFLQFNTAIPPADVITAGQLVWNDLTVPFGDLSPFATVVVTTVFTATTQVISTVNQASTQGARDEYGNDLTAGQANVPIQIIPETPSTPTPAPNTDDDDDDDDDRREDAPRDTVAAASQPAPTVTAAPTAASETGETPFPTQLPETGTRGGVPLPVQVMLLASLLGAGCFMRYLFDG